MKIVDKKPNECCFDSLNDGDVFKKVGDSEYFMKIEVCADDDDTVNFICLDDGAVGGYMEGHTIVIKVNCELIIK